MSSTWGFSAFLGNNSSVSSATPVQVVGLGGSGYLTQIVQVAAGSGSVLALRGDGTVWSWGYNESGELGLGTIDNTAHLTPAEVVGPGSVGYLTGVAAVVAGRSHSLALKTDGSVWAWGSTGYGELGTGNLNQPNTGTPVQVVGPSGSGAPTGVVSVAAGDHFSLALKSDGTVWSTRTYFGPRRGQAYFNDQPGAAPWTPGQ